MERTPPGGASQEFVRGQAGFDSQRPDALVDALGHQQDRLRQEYKNLREIEALDREWHEEGQRSADRGSPRNNRTIQEENEELDNSFGRKQNYQAPNAR